MIMPTKITQPVDSIFLISSEVLSILSKENLFFDDLLEKINHRYYKQISVENLVLSIDFLYLIGKVKLKNEIITINIE